MNNTLNIDECLIHEISRTKIERDIAVNALQELAQYGSAAGSGMCKIIRAANSELAALNQPLPEPIKIETDKPEREPEPWEELVYERMFVKNNKCLHGVSIAKPCQWCFEQLPF